MKTLQDFVNLILPSYFIVSNPPPKLQARQ